MIRKGTVLLAGIMCVSMLLTGCSAGFTEETPSTFTPDASQQTTLSTTISQQTDESGTTLSTDGETTGTSEVTTASVTAITSTTRRITTQNTAKVTTKATTKVTQNVGKTEAGTLPTVKTTKTNKPTTTTTKKPTPQTPLSELPVAQYYGRPYLAKQSNSAVLLKFYDDLVKGIPALQESFAIDSLTQSEFLLAFECYRSDYPQHFWLGDSYLVGTIGDKVVQFKPTYTASSKADLTSKQSKFESAVKTILKGVSGSLSEYDRALMLHDRLVQHVTYTNGANEHNAYGALVEGKAVCEGYARAYQYLCYRAGIQALLAYGRSRGMIHVWNIVRVDGQYMHVDPTWDDPVGENLSSDFVGHTYFGVTTSALSSDHAISSENMYAYPNCTQESLFYYRRIGAYMTAYNEDAIAKLLNAGNGKAAMYFSNGTKGFPDWLKAHLLGLVQKVSGTYTTYTYICNDNEVTLEFINI